MTNSAWNCATQPSLSRSQIYGILHILNAVPILYHAVTSNARTFMQNYHFWRCHMQGHMLSFRISVLYLASTKGWLMSQVFFQSVWVYSMFVGFSQPPILASIQSVVDKRCWHSALRMHLFWQTWQGIHQCWCTWQYLISLHWTAVINIYMNHWCHISCTLQSSSRIQSFSTMWNLLHHSSHYPIALNPIFTAYTLSPTFPNFLTSLP